MAHVSTTTRRTLSASTLKGDKVRNPQNENLGNVEDLMIDLDTGRVAYCVLSFGGFLGMGEKLFAVPWRAMTIDTEDHAFVLNVTKDRLKDAPGFDKDHWPDLTDADLRSQIYGFYNVRPDWE
ncbi:MAG: PRC-barrel domain-containing protein [Syntrophomonadaceae bacterium]